jgi:branched-chain amino acid transport system substrate-binding protein
MSMSPGRKHSRRLRATALTAVAWLALAACSDSSAGPAQGAGIPAVIHLLGVRDQTGPVSYTGISAAKGTALAIKEITGQHFLGDGVTIEVDERDAAFNPQTASSEITTGLAAGGVTAVLGPQVSNEALAVAPIAQSSGVPIVFTQSGVNGLLTGNMTFRASASQASIWPNATKHIIDSGAKRVAIFNSATNATYKELGGKTVPALLGKGGVKVVESFDLDSTVTDFQAPVSRALDAKPDAVIATLVGPQIPTLVVQLRQAGYDGPVYTGNTMTDAQIKTMHDAGVGLMFPSTFSYAVTAQVPARFTTAYQAKFGTLPDVFAAEAYDQTWWIARAIKQAGSVNPTDVAAALLQVGKKGFTGAQGALTFENGNDAKTKGVLVQWDGSKQTIAQ